MQISKRQLEKMSKGIEISRDEDGFLKCKDCPRRFLTKLMLENHSCNQHKTDTEIKPDKIQMLQNKKVESDFQTNIIQSVHL